MKWMEENEVVLFDINNVDFSLEWEGRDLTKEIQVSIKKENTELGKIKLTRKGGWKFLLSNPHGDQILLVSKGLKARNRFLFLQKVEYEVFDKDTKIATAYQKLSRFCKSEIKNKGNQTLLTARGDDLRGITVFNDNNGNKVAEAKFENQEIKISFWKRETHYRCEFHIVNPQFDRKILWGLFMYYLGGFYD